MGADGLNRAQLVGFLGADPQLTVVGSGQARLAARLATTESYVEGKGTRKERVEWHSIVMWGKRAEALGRILRRGTRVLIEGPIRHASYAAKSAIALTSEGTCPHCGQHVKRTSTAVHVDRLLLLGASGAEGGERREQAPEDRAPGEDDNPF